MRFLAEFQVGIPQEFHLEFPKNYLQELHTNPKLLFLQLQGHTEQLFSAEWSGCGRYLATCCKDGKIRVYEPTAKSGPHPISEGGEIVPKKGARIAWVLNGQYLIVTGFSK